MIEQLRAVEKYEETPGQVPIPVSEALLKEVMPKAKFIELMAIGGECILLKAQDETGKLIAVKIARSEFQGKFLSTPQNASIVNVFSFKGKPKATNTSHERFLEGAILQRDLFQQMIDDQVSNIAIPQVYSISQDPLFFTMPFMDNISVLRFFRDFKKSLKDILLVYLNLLRGIEYIHTKSIIHRDIKSDNIFIHKNLKGVVLLDWTLSKQVGDRGLTVKGTIGGTPGLASEKMLDGNFKNANFRDDIYALGFVLWEFVTGKRIATVYELGARKMTLVKQEEFKRKIAVYLPECLQYFFWKTTDYAEKNRYNDVSEMITEIKEIIQKFDLSQNTIISIEKEKEIEQIVNVIIDTTVDVCLCEGCDSKEICRDVELCNLFYNFLRVLK